MTEPFITEPSTDTSTAGSSAAAEPPGSGEAAAGWTARTVPVAGLVGLVALIIAWFRIPDDVTGQLYAEDGRTFFGDWLTHGGWSLLIEPYAGYQHLIPRLSSLLIMTTLPVTWWAVATNLLACLLVAIAAALVFVYSRDVVTFWPSRVALGLLTVLTPIVGFEALGNLANLHWFLLYLCVWVLLATPRSTAGAIAMGVVALLCTATEPQCAIFLPLVIWRIIQSRRTWPVMAGWLIGFAGQVATTLIAPRGVATQYPPVLSTIEGYVLNVGMTLGSNNPRMLGRVLLHLSWWPGFIWIAAILAFAGFGVWKGSVTARIALVALLYGSVVSWTASFVLGSNPDFFYSEQIPAQLAVPNLIRWGTAAALMLVATIPVTVGIIAHRYPTWRRAGAGLLAGLLAIMVVNLIWIRPAIPPSWWTTVEQAQLQCPTTPDGTVKVVTPPGPDWAVGVPCSMLND